MGSQPAVQVEGAIGHRRQSLHLGLRFRWRLIGDHHCQRTLQRPYRGEPAFRGFVGAAVSDLEAVAGSRPPWRTLLQVYIAAIDPGALMAAKRCSSSREGKVLLSCWITEELRMELDRVWAAKGYRPHGRTQKGMEEMIALYLAAQQEA